MGFKFSNLGSNDANENRNPVCSDSITMAIKNTTNNSGASENSNVFNPSISNMPARPLEKSVLIRLKTISVCLAIF